MDFCKELLSKIRISKQNALIKILEHDPRPSYQKDTEREYGFNKNFMKLFILPLLSTMVMGIILLLLTKAIGITQQRLLQLVIVLGLFLLCTVIYMILLLVLHCVEEDELNGGFWGKLTYKLGELLRIF